MKYQLVLQFPANSAAEYDRLTTLEEHLTDELGDLVDGHDFGLGEFNIFLLTDDIPTTFEKAQAIVTKRGSLDRMKAAYRDLAGEEFVTLWPPGLKEFNIA